MEDYRTLCEAYGGAKCRAYKRLRVRDVSEVPEVQAALALVEHYERTHPEETEEVDARVCAMLTDIAKMQARQPENGR